MKSFRLIRAYTQVKRPTRVLSVEQLLIITFAFSHLADAFVQTRERIVKLQANET